MFLKVLHLDDQEVVFFDQFDVLVLEPLIDCFFVLLVPQGHLLGLDDATMDLFFAYESLADQ